MILLNTLLASAIIYNVYKNEEEASRGLDHCIINLGYQVSLSHAKVLHPVRGAMQMSGVVKT